MATDEVGDADQDEWVGLVQIAREAGMNPSSVRKWVLNGQLPARKHGRRWIVRRSDLYEMANSDKFHLPSPARARISAAAKEAQSAAELQSVTRFDAIPERTVSTGGVTARERRRPPRVTTEQISFDQIDAGEGYE